MARSARSSLAVALVAAALTACFAQGAVSARRIEDGAPIADPGPDAYRVWSDRSGWHLRVRSDVVRRFDGEIGVADGARVSLVGLPADAVARGGGRLRFSFLAGREAGLDWAGGQCVDLALYVDGDGRPLRTFVGAYGASPSRVPETVCR
jgi:hypothetical protein